VRASAAVEGGLPLRTVARAPLPGPSVRFDYGSVDGRTNRLYLAHMDAGRVLVVDLRARRVIRQIAAPGVHGVLAVPALGRVYASATDAHQVLTIDGRTGAVLVRVVTAFAAHGRRLVKLGEARLAPEAHTVAVDGRTHLVYFALEHGASGRPELLVMRPS